MTRNTIILLITLIPILAVGVMADEVFAVSPNQEYNNPTQSNALASYDSTTNQVTVTWNFDTLPVDVTKCLIKGDLYYDSDIRGGPANGVTAFIPLFYSVDTSNPVILESINLGFPHVAEEVSCTDGNMVIDLDTVMSHSENYDNHPDLEIFLSFYVPDPVTGDYDVGNILRIDEVFILYSPSNNFNGGLIFGYACPDQIGNVLYIDPTGIRGNNGDNCDQLITLTDNQWVDIGMDGAPDDGIVTFGIHDKTYDPLILVVNYAPTAVDDNVTTSYNTPLILLYSDLLDNDYDLNGDDIVLNDFVSKSIQGGSITFGLGDNMVYTPPVNFVGIDYFTYNIKDIHGALSEFVKIFITVGDVSQLPEPEKEKGGGGGCSDCTPPTLGLDSNGALRVRDGITINGHSEDGGYFHTDYPMQYTKLHYQNNIVLKYYENGGPQNISIVQLGIGIKEIGKPISESQALIEVHMDYFSGDIDNPTMKELVVIDPDGILSNNVSATVSLATCSDSFSDGIVNVKLSDSFEDKAEFYRNLIDSTCLSVDFKYSYHKVPDSWVLGSNAIDYNRNTINNYFNDGLTVIDPNPAPVEKEPEPYKYECKDPVQQSMTRNNCNFEAMKSYEIVRALEVLNIRYD